MLENRQIGKIETAASMLAETIGPTLAAEWFRARRGSSLSISTSNKATGGSNALEAAGILVYPEKPVTGALIYGSGKLVEGIQLGLEKLGQRAEKKRKIKEFGDEIDFYNEGFDFPDSE